MNEIITQLICNAIDSSKIPGLDYFDMKLRPDGKFTIVLNDGTAILIQVSIEDPQSPESHEG